MNEVLPTLAAHQQMHSMRLTGYWVKITDTKSFAEAVGAHMEIMRYMTPGLLTSAAAAEAGGFTVDGDVMLHKTATIAPGCKLGPRVVVGPNCVIESGVRLEDVTLLDSVTICAHALIKRSLIGWQAKVGKWCFIEDSILGEEVEVREALLLHGATVLPHKELTENIRTEQIVI